MDDKFMENIRTFAIQDEGSIVSAAAPTSTTQGLSTRPPTSRARSDEITTLASYRPDSAAFAFSFNNNRPRTGAMTAKQRGHRHPSASIQNQFSTANDYIPDLDEVREEDMTMTVAAAPAYESQNMTTLKELDADLLESKTLAVVDGVDLRKLCRFLVPEKDLVEPDELWTWDRLYTEVMSSVKKTGTRFTRTTGNNFD